jgi:hypothetical protein
MLRDDKKGSDLGREQETRNNGYSFSHGNQQHFTTTFLLT